MWRLFTEGRYIFDTIPLILIFENATVMAFCSITKKNVFLPCKIFGQRFFEKKNKRKSEKYGIFCRDSTLITKVLSLRSRFIKVKMGLGILLKFYSLQERAWTMQHGRKGARQISRAKRPERAQELHLFII